VGSSDCTNRDYLCVNHLLLWGEISLDPLKKYNSIDNIYYTGCQALSYYSNKRQNIISNISDANRNKRNIIFFDNKLHKNYNPEQSYFRYVELMIKCSELFDVNVFFRPKAHDPFNEKLFNDKERLVEVKKKLDNSDISMVGAQNFDVMSVISMADIVIYHMVGTPSMLALMLDIPALSFYYHIDEIPDPIMKNYLNELVFDDQDAFIAKIKGILNGEESPCLRKEDKEQLSRYLDNKGLARLQHIISNIVNGHGSSVCEK
jgi:hypothetical protein